MAENEKAAAKAKKKGGKTTRSGRKHENTKTHKYYKTEGGKLERTSKHCPRCGQGTWLAAHKGRQYCGRCGYTIFEKKSQS